MSPDKFWASAVVVLFLSCEPLFHKELKTDCRYHRLLKSSLRSFFFSHLEYLNMSHRRLQEVAFHVQYSSSGADIINSGIFLYSHGHTSFLSKSFTTHIPHWDNALFWSETQHLTAKVTDRSYLQEFPVLDVWLHQLPGDGGAQTFCSVPIYYDYPISSIQLVVHSCYLELLLQSHHPGLLVPAHQLKAGESGNSVEISILFRHCRSRSILLLTTTTPWEMENPRFASKP